MANRNVVDIVITADTAQAVGGVTGLEKDLRDLGGVLEGELKQKALASADALQKIGAQQGAINNFKELKRETQALGLTLDVAAQAVDKLGSELPQVSAASKALGDAQDKARAEMVAVKNELIEQRAALTKLNADLKAGAVSSDEYKTSSVQLKQAITELNTNFKEKRTVQAAGSQAAVDAAKAEKALTTEYAAALAAARQAAACRPGKDAV